MPPVPAPTSTPAHRTANGQWAKGHSGRTAYDAGRARRQLNVSTIAALQEAFNRGGRKAIDKVMKNNPAMFLKMLVLLVPREMQIEHSSTVKQMSDAQIEDAIAAIEAMLAARGGAAAKVIEHEPAQLPAPRLAVKRKRKVVKAVGSDEGAPNSPAISGIGEG
jgi:hypothetical protein